MSWAIEEYVEDALVAYLKANVSGDLRVYAAGVEDEIKLPALMVHCGDGKNVSDTGDITGRREFSVTVEIRSEAASLLDDAGIEIATARERFRMYRDQVSSRLFDCTLHTSLNLMMPDRVLFSMAYPTATSGRTIEGRDYVAQWTLEVIAQGVQ